MKKNLLKLLALTFVLALAMTFTGCGSRDDNASVPRSETTNTTPEPSDPSSSDKTSDDESDAAKPSDSTDETGSSEDVNMLEELVANPYMQQMAEQMSTDEYKAELLSENGNVLIYRYTLVEQLDLSDESINELFINTVNSGLDSLVSTYQSTLDELRSELGMDDLVIRIEYLNADGTVIFTRDFE